MSKQIKSKAVVSGFLFAALFAFAGSSFAGIANSKHDLSTSGGGTIKATAQTEICVFCHTPHGASATANTPLWNHTMSASAGFGVYTNSNSMNATATAITGTDGSTSSLCMSCHDGTIAVNSQNNPSNNAAGVAGNLMAGAVTLITGAGSLGQLTNDHPVNFAYASSIAGGDTALVAEATVMGAGYGVKLFGAAGSATVQCASCHDVHDGSASTAPFLRTTMTGSALCLKCHVK